jgi:hypothetical protein
VYLSRSNHQCSRNAEKNLPGSQINTEKNKIPRKIGNERKLSINEYVLECVKLSIATRLDFKFSRKLHYDIRLV